MTASSKTIGSDSGRTELKELSFLFDVGQLLDQSLDLREVVRPVLDLLADRMGLVRGTLTLLNRETNEISIEVAHGLSRSQIEKGKYVRGEGITGQVIETGKPIVISHVSEEPRFLNRTGARKNFSGKDEAFLCVPIRHGSEVVGALSVDRAYPLQVPLEEDLRLLKIVAHMMGQAVRLRRRAMEERQRLEEENVRLQAELKERFRPSQIIGNSKPMQRVYDQIAQVANSPTTVLIRGESGTGKELVAQAIHFTSPRAAKPFIRVNCSALPETLVESELFGHEKGAFTGALARRKGRFELAHGGTIFLDEIGDFSPGTQVKLLRVLQEREFERVGDATPIKADVRVVAATHRDLEAMIADGRFRQDLYYRLNVFTIYLPPLRERIADVLLLADHLAEKYGKIHGKKILRISTPAIDMLTAYHWPGNVRELENCVERAVLVSADGVIHGHHLAPTLQTAEASGTDPRGSLQAALDNLERELLLEALKTARGNAAKAARALGITERVMGIRVKKHGIHVRRFRAQS